MFWINLNMTESSTLDSMIETNQPIWTSLDGRKFYHPSEFETEHLKNIVTYLDKARRPVPDWVFGELNLRNSQK